MIMQAEYQLPVTFIKVVNKEIIGIIFFERRKNFNFFSFAGSGDSWRLLPESLRHSQIFHKNLNLHHALTDKFPVY